MRGRLWMAAALVAIVGGSVQGETPAARAQAAKPRPAATLRPEDAAQAVAEAWVVLADAGKYGDAWDKSAKIFQSTVPRTTFVQAAAGARDPLGKVVSRTLKSREYLTQLPGAPDGRYVVIQYQTVFANKKDTLETITPMADPDGVWRVSGYSIK
jgi:Protein of unknown function (DUF4019)